jgi:DNA repair exonuclease SbcCD ATPase subunit
MRITRLYLRNYRVYEDELNLEIPPGLVGIYGPNGGGKSVLLESVRFALYGKARTDISEIRTSGVADECIAECEFEHEGHLYVVRRSIKGGGKTPKTDAEAHADGHQIADGPRDTAKYVHSVLGMDDTAFRASVFAEQKQIDAFSEHTPGARKKLVLSLLGITPLDGARDNARRDARDTAAQYEKLRDLLPDPEALRVSVEDLQASAQAHAVAAHNEAGAVAAAEVAAAKAAEDYKKLDATRQDYELIVQEGKAARAEADRLTADVATLEAEQAELATAADRLAELEPVAATLEPLEARLRAVEQVAAAAANLARFPELAAPDPLPEAECDAARAEAERTANAVAGLDGRLHGANAQLESARAHLEKSAALTGEGACPTCGQALGEAFEQVQAHRAAEVRTAEEVVAALSRERADAAGAAQQAARLAKEFDAALRAGRKAWQEYETAAGKRQEAVRAYELAVAALGGAVADGEADELRRRVVDARAAVEAAAMLRGRLGRKATGAAELETKREQLAQTTGRVETLREKVKALGHDAAALEAARQAADAATTACTVATRRHQAAVLEAEKAKAKAEAEAARLAEVEAQHAQLESLRDSSRYLGRLSELLQNFRNGVVAKVGPMLEAQAGSLFAELTDHEYDGFEVDPETYEIKLRDGAGLYGMRRFSGSETDLANLALRVAISEQVRLQSGGAVGLLVLDEVFGPLDPDRKERMLLALERLKARFRQVLVVTHDSEIKEQLPHAIEVVKLPGRRATAHVVNA